MKTLIILIQQSSFTAVLEILMLLLVAAIIGYITSYLYYKAVYTKKINILEVEKNELKKQIETSKREIEKLEQTIKQKDTEIEEIKKPRKKES
jgi:septal ring factor EnvC (AmiA/AmiB activator)